VRFTTWITVSFHNSFKVSEWLLNSSGTISFGRVVRANDRRL
jgi:hypothetical protein